ncbi:zinc finger [Seminavis robusta]|uniref:Zinc finger n=1 Tax=Seminavis robusta TaxID=568900 RepID=A0A9N8HLN9_9STRA|nr:zinc finger [Seminavis robusta]|eukprot:Sro825_g207630.1 zinc finger (328) ;mRNA; f:7636-8619
MAHPPAASRRSTRKCQSPVRLGFDDDGAEEKNKRQKTTHGSGNKNSALLEALPEEIIQRIICEDLADVSNHFSLQSTNKLFYKLSRSAEGRKSLKLLDGENSTFPLKPSELLPYANNNNMDAIYLLAMIAVYVEDDLEVGFSLLERGARDGHNLAKHELGILLKRVSKTAGNVEEYLKAGQEFINEAAAAGLAISALEKNQQNRQLREKAGKEVVATLPLMDLVAQKPPAPRPKWQWTSCSNPSCMRGSYIITPRCRRWLALKDHSEDWKSCRSLVQSCGMQSAYFCPESPYSLNSIPLCAGCRETPYCSRSCQRLDWPQHRRECSF